MRITQPAIQWVLWALLLDIKCSRNEADHLSPTSAEFNKEWNYTSTLPHAFMMCKETTYFLVNGPLLFMFLAQDPTYS